MFDPSSPGCHLKPKKNGCDIPNVIPASPVNIPKNKRLRVIEISNKTLISEKDGPLRTKHEDAGSSKMQNETPESDSICSTHDARFTRIAAQNQGESVLGFSRNNLSSSHMFAASPCLSKSIISGSKRPSTATATEPIKAFSTEAEIASKSVTKGQGIKRSPYIGRCGLSPVKKKPTLNKDRQKEASIPTLQSVDSYGLDSRSLIATNKDLCKVEKNASKLQTSLKIAAKSAKKFSSLSRKPSTSNRLKYTCKGAGETAKDFFDEGTHDDILSDYITHDNILSDYITDRSSSGIGITGARPPCRNTRNENDFQESGNHLGLKTLGEQLTDDVEGDLLDTSNDSFTDLVSKMDPCSELQLTKAKTKDLRPEVDP